MSEPVPHEPDERKGKRRLGPLLAQYSGVILMLPSCMLVGFLIGLWIDDWVGWTRAASLLGALLGGAAGLYQVFKMAGRL